jgi:hypothetical protein
MNRRVVLVALTLVMMMPTAASAKAPKEASRWGFFFRVGHSTQCDPESSNLDLNAGLEVRAERNSQRTRFESIRVSIWKDRPHARDLRLLVTEWQNRVLDPPLPFARTFVTDTFTTEGGCANKYPYYAKARIRKVSGRPALWLRSGKR